MNKYQVKYEDGAKKDIFNIIDCIENELLNPAGAAKIAIKIYRKCESLSAFPNGSKIKYTDGTGRELRFAYVKKYTIVYYIEESSLTVYIRAIINSRRDLGNILKNRD